MKEKNHDYQNFKKVSPASDPVDGTVLFITHKAAPLLEKLNSAKKCLVYIDESLKSLFAETVDAGNMHEARFVPDAKSAYYDHVKRIAKSRRKENKKVHYLNFLGPGYIKLPYLDGQAKVEVYLQGPAVFAETARFDANVELGPYVFIDHDCRIGRGVKIGASTVVQNCEIGDKTVIGAGCRIGGDAYNLLSDETGRLHNIPALGKVKIAKHAFIGSSCDISRGLAGDTVIADNVMIDSMCKINHDVHIDKAAQICAGTITGGFVKIGEGAFVGMNSCLKNRVNIGKKAKVGMSSAVLHDIEEYGLYYGNPARPGDSESPSHPLNEKE